MYECVQVGENTFFMDCPSRVGIYRDGGAAWLIDSGSDKDAAKKVLKILDDLGLCLEAAIVTHYHADHVAGLPGLLLSAGNSGKTSPLTIAGPPGLRYVVPALMMIAPVPCVIIV